MLTFREAKEEDALIYFDWVNDALVREQSYKTKEINLSDHINWFNSKLEDKNCTLLIFQDADNLNVGQIRIELQDSKNAIIGISIAAKFRGMGLAKEMLNKACQFTFEKKSDIIIHAFIKKDNLGSKHTFEKVDFKLLEITNYEEHESFHYIKNYENS